MALDPEGSPPMFSVIVPVFNRGALVDACIRSVLAQSNQSYELIVVDDGSTDDTKERVAVFGRKIQLLSQRNQGPEVARNRGAQEARGQYLVFLDSDDELTTNALDVYARVIRNRSHPPLVLGSVRESIVGEPSPPPSDDDEIRFLEFQDYFSSDRGLRPNASAIVVRSALFWEARGWRNSTSKTYHGDDLNFMLRVGDRGPFVVIVNPSTVVYGRHATNSVQDRAWIVAGIHTLIASDHSNLYPGGSQRKLERQAVIGRSVIWQSRRCFAAGQRRLAVGLLLAGRRMVISTVLRETMVRLSGKQEPQSLV